MRSFFVCLYVYMKCAYDISEVNGLLYTLRELECRDVINLYDGRLLGRISDLEIDSDSGKTTAIYISAGSFWSAGKDEVRIPWEDIRCVGEDAVLVEFRRECGCSGRRVRKNSWWNM